MISSYFQGKARGSTKKMSLKPKSVGRKRRKRRNCDDDSDEELDSYIPRPSRRRAAARAQKVEEEEEEEEEVTSKTSNTDKKQRVPCKYGENCYRHVVSSNSVVLCMSWLYVFVWSLNCHYLCMSLFGPSVAII